ncbi:DUF1104 domain-containing protein [Malaciobacter molluscorum LMG 25693]|uniref:DUF1104 domain-containing protein n=1 Tax=Malaciobacter molluscorum LMG 25693 TaxID=870501 RepID=A0A2G1DKN9_9BACT|nr:DUF1104 domain-containing protein [Malaciobacter molluscorum]AXX92596.1 hypothetical protein AMOL_1629 [Malaciobacter molluscorum LMG 25693]PHO19020.1 DUF1104 domain-containing protein [Malaciobacter molluscorum LMG 25693]
MLKVIFIMMIFFSSIFGKTDFSEMSTQELIAIMGYVKPHEQRNFNQELKSRIPTMNEKEKKAYIKNKKRMNR